MSNVLLKQSVPQALTMGKLAPVQGEAPSSAEGVTLAGIADDITAHPDEVRVDVSYAGGTPGSAVSVFLVQSNFDGSVIDGDIAASATDVGSEALPNLGIGLPVITQATLTKGSAVFRCTTSKFIIVVQNNNADALSALAVTVTPLNYESI